MKTFYLETYGCQMNEADSELVAAQLTAAGYRRVERPEEAGVILANTCAVRDHAEQRVLGRLNELGRNKLHRPDVVLGVLGCMSQRLKDRLLEQVGRLDLVVGPDAYRRLPQLIEEAACTPTVACEQDRDETYADLRPQRVPGVRAWITIMRGCDRFCSYCIVPHVRGRERCVPADAVLAEVRQAAEQGFKEVVLLGQTVNSYRYEAVDFADLLRQVDRVEGVQRIRFTSPHPADMSDEVIAAMAGCQHVCPHLHLPLQSASDAVLKRMHRNYTVAEYDELITRLRAAIPDLALSTDVIVGFPGETEADFLATLTYLSRVRFDSAFMFKYSPRPGTLAARWEETVSEEEKGERLRQVIDTQEAISRELNARWQGRRCEVLVEGPSRRDPCEAVGKTPQFKTVVFPTDNVVPGSLVTVNIEQSTAHSLRGRPVVAEDQHAGDA